MNTQNILIVGAGAVGTVYGYYLQKAGHKVSFLVKPKHIADLDSGYYLNKLQSKAEPEFFNEYTLETLGSADPDKAWDVIIITLSTTALPHLDLSKINTASADVVLLSPGLDDLAVAKQKLAGKGFKSLTVGMINLISFINADKDAKAHITLKQPVKLGDSLVTCVYFPPTPMPFSDGEKADKKTEAAKRVAKLFDSAGIKAKAVKSVTKMVVYPNIFLTMLVLALEAADWSFGKLSASPELLGNLSASIKALSKASQTHYKLSPPLHLVAMQPWIFKIGLKIAPSLFGFDIEEYLAYHFTKVGEQSVEHTQSYMVTAQQHGANVEVVKQLLAAVQRKRNG